VVISDNFMKIDNLGAVGLEIKSLFTETCEQNRLWGPFYSQVIQRRGPEPRQDRSIGQHGYETWKEIAELAI
jgi:hypothetical protein